MFSCRESKEIKVGNKAIGGRSGHECKGVAGLTEVGRQDTRQDEEKQERRGRDEHS